jgi:ATP/maltotriose-dependent transcriptional regulator MalT
MKWIRILLAPAIILALVSALLNAMEYRLMILDHAAALYGGLVAVIFTITGIVVGRKISERKQVQSVHLTAEADPVKELIEYDPETSGLSKRECQILELMAEGMSNREISEKLFVSVHTVKSHASNIFDKLEVKSRTQAIVKAKSIKIIS